MAIRTLIAAAALVAFTTPAFAQGDEAIVILDETVSTGGHFALCAGLSSAAITGIIAGNVLVTVVVVADDESTTASGTF